MFLYIHVPFCARRCSYCDFAIAVRRTVPSDEYADAVLWEWRHRQADAAWTSADAAKGAQPEPLDTVYFGGGTPSRLDPPALGRILSGIRAERPIAPRAEITLEANPEDVTPAHAEAWAALGVNRVSLGVQSFDSAVLEWMHRTHVTPQVPAAVAALRQAGIDNISLDLIFGLPDTLARDWSADLDRALALDPSHLSLYGLTVEPGTPLARWTARGAVRPVPDDRYAAEYLSAHAALLAHGFEHYEVSNAGLPGRRAVHNSAYWRRAPFIGLGPSAHSGLGRERRWNLREWTAYAEAVRAGRDPTAGHEELDTTAVRLEELYLGLRTRDGVPADRVPAAALARWRQEGWATLSGGRVQLTVEGWLRLDALVGEAAGAPAAAGAHDPCDTTGSGN